MNNDTFAFDAKGLVMNSSGTPLYCSFNFEPESCKQNKIKIKTSCFSAVSNLLIDENTKLMSSLTWSTNNCYGLMHKGIQM